MGPQSSSPAECRQRDDRFLKHAVEQSDVTEDFERLRAARAGRPALAAQDWMKPMDPRLGTNGQALARFGKDRWRIVRCYEREGIAVPAVDIFEKGFANANGFLHHSCKC